MQLRPNQLERHLASTLATIYLVSGDEPLLVGETADAIRRHARERGYSTRELLEPGTGFDWRALGAAAASLSLFAERRILELRIGEKVKLGADGSQALCAYAAAPPGDTLLLIVARKLDQNELKSAWLKAIDNRGVVLRIWPVSLDQLPEWIAARLATRGLRADPEALALLAARTEGNLLAAAQAVERLTLLADGSEVDPALATEAVSDSARFDVFALADAVLAEDAGRAIKILRGLRAEGIEPVLVLWALAREIRSLALMAEQIARGAQPRTVMTQHKVWSTRQSLIGRALQRRRRNRWHALLGECADADRVIKGAAPGDAWSALLALTAHASGVHALDRQSTP